MYDLTSRERVARFFGKSYAYNDENFNATDDPLDLGRYHALLTVDPDTKGAGVFVVHDFGARDARNLIPRVSTSVFPLSRRDDEVPVIDGYDLSRELTKAWSCSPEGRMQLGMSTVLDGYIENGHSHGSFVAGRNVGVALGAVEAWTEKWPHCDHSPEARARDVRIELLTPNTWVVGLFNTKTMSKSSRVQYCAEHAPDEIRHAMDVARRQRHRRYEEAIADAWCMALYAMHRAYDEACVLAFPHAPHGAKFSTAYDDESTSPWRRPFSTLTSEELRCLLRRHKLATAGGKPQLLARVREAADVVGDVA